MINFVDQKGGVAKITSCANIGASLANHGKTVLLVNLDTQESFSTSTGLKEIGVLATFFLRKLFETKISQNTAFAEEIIERENI